MGKRRRNRSGKFSIKTKLILSFLAIAAILVISSVITVVEYRSMRNYVAELVADNISSLNVAGTLSRMSNDYNLQILAVIGSDTLESLPEIDGEYFRTHCAQLRMTPSESPTYALADSVMVAYESYMAAATELEDVLYAPGDSREWFFSNLQPRHEKLQASIDALSEAIHNDLADNSAAFRSGIYRSLVPGIVAIGAGLLLVMLLLYFIISYYVNPLLRMLRGLQEYSEHDRKYSVSFDGDDELCTLNTGISELADENQQLRRRIRQLKR